MDARELIASSIACIPKAGEVERRHKPSRDEFLAEYYSPNRPVIITGMMDDWPAMRKWSLDYFFGAVRASARSRCRWAGIPAPIMRSSPSKFMRRIRFGDFVEMVRNAGETNDFYLTANNDSHNRKALAELWEDIVQIPEYLRRTSPAASSGWARPARSRRSTTTSPTISWPR